MFNFLRFEPFSFRKCLKLYSPCFPCKGPLIWFTSHMKIWLTACSSVSCNCKAILKYFERNTVTIQDWAQLHDISKWLQVPFSVMIIWAYAFFLTAGGAYDYKGCSPDIPSSNILVDSCRKHVYTMKHCRTDVSNAMRTAAWVRIPYPLQWGTPIFHLRTSMIMIVVSLVASVDSVSS